MNTKFEDIMIPRDKQVIVDENEKKLIIKYEQDVEPLLDENAAARSNGSNGYNQSRTMRRVGSIPMIFIEKAMRETGVNLLAATPEAHRALRKLLDEHPKFRTVDKI